MKSLTTLLSNHPFLQNLPREQLDALASCAALQSFRANEKIFGKGHAADHFYLLTKGEVIVETPYLPGEGVVGVQSLAAGQPLGWSWLFPPYEWHFSARAVEDSEAIVFDAGQLRSLAEKDSAIGYQLAMRVGQMLNERLQYTRTRLINLCEVV